MMCTGSLGGTGGGMSELWRGDVVSGANEKGVGDVSSGDVEERTGTLGVLLGRGGVKDIGGRWGVKVRDWSRYVLDCERKSESGEDVEEISTDLGRLFRRAPWEGLERFGVPEIERARATESLGDIGGRPES